MSAAVRTKEQLAVMLKMIDVNQHGLKHGSTEARLKIWQAITKKLNSMKGGAIKDLEGWKKSYACWRSNVGVNLEYKKNKILKQVIDGDDEYFVNDYINPESTDCIEAQYILSDYAEIMHDEPTQQQKQRLEELILEHKQLLQSNADDNELKQRIWLNIAEELNALPDALELTVNTWKKLVDWSKYEIKRSKKSIQPSYLYDKKEKNNITEIKKDLENSYEFDAPELKLQDIKSNVSNEDYYENLETLFDEIDEDFGTASTESRNESDVEFEPQKKRIKPTPLVKSFKFSNRMVTAMDKMNENVDDIKTLLQRQATALESMERLAQEQNKNQILTNTLLKKNAQLLKVLVQFKTGKRKRNSVGETGAEAK